MEVRILGAQAVPLDQDRSLQGPPPETQLPNTIYRRTQVKGTSLPTAPLRCILLQLIKFQKQVFVLFQASGSLSLMAHTCS